MKFVYPVDPKNGNDKYPFYLKGASNLTGYYPIGRMNTWHGGIHYEGNNPIKAIADGKIIAFRVPENYYEETIDGKTSKYSNGFILIEHNYKSPNGLELTFYSLYNHLMSFDEMEKKSFPKFLTIDSYTVADNANDTITVKGATIKASSDSNVTLAVAAKGTMLTFLEEPNKNNRRKVKYVTPQGKEIIGYIWIKKYDGKQLVDTETGEVLEDQFSGSNGDRGANLREEANTTSDVDQLLLRGTSLEIDEKDQGKTGWLKVKKAGGKKVSGYCHTDGLSIVDVVTLKEDDLNNVISDQCYEVKAGDVIGFAGLNGFEKKEEYRGVHVEVFTHQEVNDFLTNAKGDGEKNKSFAKLTEGTELKKKLPLKMIKNLPVKKTGKTTEGYCEVEVDNLEVVVNDRDTELPKTYESKIYTFCSESNVAINATRLTEFNKLVGDIAQMGDTVRLKKQLQGKQRRVVYQTPNKGQIFWVKNDELEEKTLTFSIETTTTVATNANQETANNTGTQGRATGALPTQANNTQTTEVTSTTTETKKYFRLSKELSEVYIISPEENNINTKIEADVIVNTKGSKEFTDKDDKKWYLLEPTGLQKNGVAINYKGLICEDDLGETFSAYNWSKFGFEVKEDADNNYIYDFEDKSSFFSDICNIVDEDNNGILEPIELQHALSNHYTANKLSHLVCKHHNEWAYSGNYLSPLMDEVTAVLQKGIDLEKDEKRKQELETLKEERLDAFEAKVNQLALWGGVEARKSSYRTKFVNGTLMTSALAMGTYLTYKYGKWLYKKISYGDEPEKEIQLSPFPIEEPVVYHFHPVAFVEQMRRMSNTINWSETPIVKLIVSKESKGFYSAYNILGKTSEGNIKVYESHFEVGGKYDIQSMTIKEILDAQATYEGVNNKHLFAVGLYQMIPVTLNGFIAWIKSKREINESSQLFNEEFQNLAPWYFWEKKRPKIGKYFEGNTNVDKAAFEIAKEWASAGTPKGYKIASGIISDGTQSYYDGDGVNSAHYSANKTIEALEKTKEMIEKLGGYEYLKNNIQNK